jgi:hypothetical protein
MTAAPSTAEVARRRLVSLPIYQSGRIGTPTAGHSDAPPSGGMMLGLSIFGLGGCVYAWRCKRHDNPRYLPWSSDRVRGHTVRNLWPHASRGALCSVDGSLDGSSRAEARTPCCVGTIRMRPKAPLPAEHKFRAGQRVTLAPNLTNRSATGGGYVVMRQLPERNGEFEYRIKSISEPHERVARESELARE